MTGRTNKSDELNRLNSAARPMAIRAVKLGCEELIGQARSLLAGKRIGIVTNHSAVFPDGRHIVDVLLANPDMKIGALFSPEHGIRGDSPAGKHVGNEVDPKTGIQIYSLYGEHNKPERFMLEGIDVLVYDIQDVGVRFYTYISTLTLVMEAAAETGIPLLLADRPLVIHGGRIEGPVLKDDVRSFIGMLPLPVLYSLTPGELSGFITEMYLRPKGLRPQIEVLKLKNYSRSSWYDETGLKWIAPSPNIPTIAAAAVYPGTALVEGTNLNEGRGTDHPFTCIGAPFVDKLKLENDLNSLGLEGVKFTAADYTPKPLAFVPHPRFSGEVCHGIEVIVTDRNLFKPVEAGVAIVRAVKRIHPSEFAFRADGAFDRLAGDRRIRQMIERGADSREITSTWESDIAEFEKLRKRFFLY